jgi:hypothetical protein
MSTTISSGKHSRLSITPALSCRSNGWPASLGEPDFDMAAAVLDEGKKNQCVDFAVGGEGCGVR